MLQAIQVNSTCSLYGAAWRDVQQELHKSGMVQAAQTPVASR